MENSERDGNTRPPDLPLEKSVCTVVSDSAALWSAAHQAPLSLGFSRQEHWSGLCIQISQEAGQVVWYSHLLENFPQFVVIHTVKGFGIVNKTEIDVFLELSCFLDDPADVGNLISGSFAFPKSSLNIWKFMVHVLLKPGLENFEHYFARDRKSTRLNSSHTLASRMPSSA